MYAGAQKRMIIFQGTFDPFTTGHLTIVQQAASLFGEVCVLLLVNPDKTPLFSVEERKQMIIDSVSHIPGVSVDSFDGLLVDYMRPRHINWCVRGVRNALDAAYELHNAHLSSALYPALCTLLLPCPVCWSMVSSSAVKEACQKGELPAGWVPTGVLVHLQKKFSFRVI